VTRLGAILLIFAGLFAVLFGVYSELSFRLLTVFNAPIADSILYDIIYMAVFMIPVAFVPAFFKREERQPMRLGVKLPRNTFALIFICIAISYAFANINSSVVTAIFGADTTDPLFNYPVELMSDTDLILEFITVALVPAFCEEFLFRGAILSTLMPYGKSTAVVVSAVCFGLMHGNFHQFLYTTVAGIILGAVYVATDSIWPSTIIHMMNNALSILQIAMYERLDVNYASLLWVLIEAAIMTAGIVSLVCIVRRRKKEDGEKASLFGRPLELETHGFSTNAKLDARDSVKLFFAPTIIVFVVYQILLGFLVLVAR
jgi:membrane protease YdiL (CAAX protease family)